nr:MAG TPA: hypothetical protein [Caudoviricetes sp.]
MIYLSGCIFTLSNSILLFRFVLENTNRANKISMVL